MDILLQLPWLFILTLELDEEQVAPLPKDKPVWKAPAPLQVEFYSGQEDTVLPCPVADVNAEAVLDTCFVIITARHDSHLPYATTGGSTCTIRGSELLGTRFHG